MRDGKVRLAHTFAANAMQRETSSPLLSIRVVIMHNLVLSTKETRSSTFSLSDGCSMFFWVYGSAALEPVSVLLNDILGLDAFEVQRCGEYESLEDG